VLDLAGVPSSERRRGGGRATLVLDVYRRAGRRHQRADLVLNLGTSAITGASAPTRPARRGLHQRTGLVLDLGRR